MQALLRRPARLVLNANRAYATASTPYVPPASLKDMDPPQRRKELLKPDSPSYYTGKSNFYDGVELIQDAIHTTSNILRSLSLLPLPDFARASLPPLMPVWKNKAEMTSVFECALTTARYRRAVQLLNQLNDMRRIAETAGCQDVVQSISSVVVMFEKSNKEEYLNRGKRKPVQFDEHGRTYTVGKRKTSAARVWVIPASAGKAATNVDGAAKSVGSILVNNLPLSTYFPLPADREKVVRPLKITGLLGAYNVFALVRGGGTTGQSGAVAHGLAKGLAAHAPDTELILRRCLSLSYLSSVCILTSLNTSQTYPPRPPHGGEEEDWLGESSQTGMQTSYFQTDRR